MKTGWRLNAGNLTRRNTYVAQWKGPVENPNSLRGVIHHLNTELFTLEFTYNYLSLEYLDCSY